MASHQPTPLQPASSQSPSLPPPSFPDRPPSDDELHEEEDAESWTNIDSVETDSYSSTDLGSLRGSVLGALSTSSEGESSVGRFGSAASSDSGIGDHDVDDVSQDGDLTPERGTRAIPLPLTPSLLGGAFTEAESPESRLTSSLGTIHANSVTSSQIRLVFPSIPTTDASFSSGSGTLSAQDTPAGSLASLLPTTSQPFRSDPEHGVRIGLSSTKCKRGESPGRIVAESWLRDSRLYAGNPENTDDYQPLGSQEFAPGQWDETRTNAEVGKVETDRTVKVEADEAKLVEAAVATKVERERQVLRGAQLMGLGGLARKWAVGVSFFALASGLSMVLLGSFGPGSAIPIGDQIARVKSTLPPAFTQITSGFWDSLPATVLAPSTVSAESHPTGSSSRTPDLNVIRQALSTFSTADQHETPSLPSTTESCLSQSSSIGNSGRSGRRREARTSTICRRLLAPAAPILTISSGGPSSGEQPLLTNPMNETQSTCHCGLVEHISGELSSLVLAPVKNFGVSALQLVDNIWGPTLAILMKDYQEVMSLARTIAASTEKVSASVIRRAAKGAMISRHALATLVEKASTSLPRAREIEAESQALAREAIVKAKMSLDILSEYVEGQLSEKGKSFREKGKALQEGGKSSVYQARRGLDRVLEEAWRTVEDDSPFDHFPLKRHHSTGRSKGEGTKEGKGATRRVLPPPEKPSTMSQVWDMIHHVSLTRSPQL
ncbi:hypothetical protein P7C73_g4317, partial [Tremellales sp. Uapishka_1]